MHLPFWAKVFDSPLITVHRDRQEPGAALLTSIYVMLLYKSLSYVQVEESYTNFDNSIGIGEIREFLSPPLFIPDLSTHSFLSFTHFLPSHSSLPRLFQMLNLFRTFAGATALILFYFVWFSGDDDTTGPVDSSGRHRRALELKKRDSMCIKGKPSLTYSFYLEFL